MDSTKYVCWKDNDQWLGYLLDNPDYWTQGESLEDLKFHLSDLADDLSRPDIRQAILGLL